MQENDECFCEDILSVKMAVKRKCRTRLDEESNIPPSCHFSHRLRLDDDTFEEKKQ